MKKWIVWALMLTLCVLPALNMAIGEAVTAETLFASRSKAAAAAGRTVAYTITAELGDGAAMLVQDPATLAAVKSGLDALEIRFAHAGMPQAGQLEIAISGTPVLAGTVAPDETGISVFLSSLPGKSMYISYADLGKMLESSFGQTMGTEGVSSSLAPIIGMVQSSASGTLIDQQQANDAFSGLAASFEQLVQKYGSEFETETVVRAVEATDVRDAAATTVIMKITPEQFKSLTKDILTMVNDNQVLGAALGMAGSTTSVGDAASALQVITESLETMEPLSDPVVYTMHYDESNTLVGADVVVPQLFVKDEFKITGTYTYNRKTEGAKQTHTFLGDVQSAEGQNTKFEFSAYQDGTDPMAPKSGFDMTFNMPAADSTQPASVLGVHGSYETKNTATSESTVAKLWFDGDPQMAMMMPAVSFANETAAVGENDFTVNGKFDISMAGMPMAALNWTVASSDKALDIPAAGTVVNVAALTDEENTAFTNELTTGLMQALSGAMALLPPETLAVLMPQPSAAPAATKP